MSNVIVRPKFKNVLIFAKIFLLLMFPPIIFICLLPILLIHSKILAVIITLSLISFTFYSFHSLYKSAYFTISDASVRYDLDFFLYTKKKEILFKNIKEVEVRANLLQKFFGLGSIVLHTHAAGTHNRPGITLYDLDDAESVYALIQKNVSKAIES